MNLHATNWPLIDKSKLGAVVSSEEIHVAFPGTVGGTSHNFRP